MDWLNPLAGFLVGTLVGLTGVGGGSLMAPILILLFGYAPAAAVGTDLWFAGITKTIGGYMHHRQGGVDRLVLLRLMAGSIPGAIATLIVLNSTGAHQIKDGIIITSLGVVLILTALATLFRQRFIDWSRYYQRAHGHDALNLQRPLTWGAGLILGVLVTLTSVGAGALGVTMILCLYPLRMYSGRLVATDIVHAVPLTIVAGIGYALMPKSPMHVHGHMVIGNVDISLLIRLLAGSIPGIIIGSVLTKYISERALRILLALVLCAVGLKMLIKF